jgi:hypothetical protein
MSWEQGIHAVHQKRLTRLPGQCRSATNRRDELFTLKGQFTWGARRMHRQWSRRRIVQPYTTSRLTKKLFEVGHNLVQNTAITQPATTLARITSRIARKTAELSPLLPREASACRLNLNSELPS